MIQDCQQEVRGKKEVSKKYKTHIDVLCATVNNVTIDQHGDFIYLPFRSGLVFYPSVRG